MSGGRAPGCLGATDKRPAARTLGQDSGEKAQHQDVDWRGDAPSSLMEGAGHPQVEA